MPEPLGTKEYSCLLEPVMVKFPVHPAIAHCLVSFSLHQQQTPLTSNPLTIMAVIVHEDTEVRAANPKWRCSTDGPSINVNHLERHGFQLRIHFMRTVRVPDNKSASKLPPDLGRFALFKIQDYAANLPTQMVAQGGLFFPMYRK